MAYVKFKELTKSFEFNKELTIDDLPKYVLDYVSEKEFIYKCYKFWNYDNKKINRT